MRRRSLFLAPLVATLMLGPLLPVGCGSSPSSEGASGGGHGGSGFGGAGGAGGTGAHDGGLASGGGAGGTGGGSLFDDHSDCSTGQACGDGGVCAGNVCCTAALACGDICCASGDVCSFKTCVTPGAACHDSTDCSGSEYCEYSLGDNTDAGVPDAACVGGAAQLNGKCLPTPPTCAADAGAGDGGTVDCLEQCTFHPVSTFSPSVAYAWGSATAPPFASDVMMTPIVVQLDDDDCDGKISAHDIPEIVFSTFSNGNYHGDATATLHAISIVGGKMVEKWNVAGVVDPTKQIAGGDIDGLAGNEVVACGMDGALHAFKGDGSPLWTSPAMSCFMPSISDLDGDGKPEVVIEGGILDGATGAIEQTFATALNGPFVLSDIDGDGEIDVVTSSRGYHKDGTVFVDTMLAADGTFSYGTEDWKGPWSAVADFDHDGKPEVVVIDNLNHALSMWRYDASQPNKFSVVHAPIDINSLFTTNTCVGYGATHGGGPPTIADFDGDGVPDVGTAGGIGYVVFSGKKLLDPTVMGGGTILWAQPTHDCSSASTGSSVFDFDGDGKAEVVYSDEYHLRIYDGTNGDVLFQACNTTATLIEYPVIADVDNDGHADIVVVSNGYAEVCPDDSSRQSGVRVFGGATGAWVRTRAVWNEHAYHVTNVNDDGTIPAHELPNWTQPGLNDFRQNKQPGSEFAAPDAVVSVASICGSPYELVATVRNIGQAALPAGVVVGFYEGAPGSGTKLGQAATTKVLYAAESEAVVLPLASPDLGLTSGTATVYVIVDDTSTPHPSWTECRTDNNTGGPSNVKCSIAQ